MKSKKIMICICIVIIILIIVLLLKNSSSIENTKLTSENYEQIITEYRENHKDTDDLTYLQYALSRNILTNISIDLSKTSEEQNSEMYKNIYGKTIKQLISEGKKLMKENGMTAEKFRNAANQFVNRTTNN